MMKNGLAMLLALALVLSLSACSGKSTIDSTNTLNNSDAISSNSTATEDVKSDESTEDNVAEEADDAVSLTVGESTELGDWTISVTAFEFLSKISDSLFSYKPDSGSQYGVVSVSITNNGTTADSFLPSFGFGDDVAAKIIYNGQYEFSSTNLLSYDEDLHDKFLNPLTSASGVIVFELPDSVVNGAESLSIKFASGANTVEFALR